MNPIALSERLTNLRNVAADACGARDRAWKAELIAHLRSTLDEDVAAGLDPETFGSFSPAPNSIDIAFLFVGHCPIIGRWSRESGAWVQIYFGVGNDRPEPVDPRPLRSDICRPDETVGDESTWWMVDIPRGFIPCYSLAVALHYAKLRYQPRKSPLAEMLGSR